MSSDIAIRAEGLGKRYRIGGRRERYRTLRDSLSEAVASLCRPAARRREGQDTIWSLRDVSFTIRRGEVVGIIGRNGAGKSTLLKVLSRITEPTEGCAEIVGRVGSLLEVGTGFHPELTGRENIYLNGAILGMRRAEIDAKFDEIVAFAEVERFVDTPVKHYSSGMYLRLAFAVAAHLEPDILLVDEVLAVGDAAFQKRCLGKMEDVARHGRTVLFVSHNMAAIRSLCETGLVLKDGRLQFLGGVAGAIESYYGSIGALGTGEQPPADHDAGLCCFGPVSINGGRGNTVAKSSPVTFSTTMTVNQGIAGFSVFLIINNANSKQILHLRQESTSLGFREGPARKYRIAVDCPPLWLNPGLYTVHFKVLFWGEYGSSRYLSDHYPLDVTGTSSGVDCVIHPDAVWSVT